MQANVFASEGPTAGALIRTTLGLARSHFGPLALLCSVGAAPLLLWMIGIAGMAQQPVLALGLMSLAFIGFLICGPTSYGAVMVAVYQAAAGRPVDVVHCLRTGFRRLPRTVLTFILYMLAVMVGFLLLIIPGIIAAFTFQLAMPVVMLEDVGPVEAMRRSRHLTEGFRLSAFGASIVLAILSFPFSMTAVFFVNNMPVYLLLTLIGAVVNWLLSFVVVGVYYFGVRSFKESLGVDQVAAVFD